LRNLDSKIIHVAEECGFNHLGLFNTCFKRRFGVSPGEWRKQARFQESAPPKGTAPVCSLESKGLCPLAMSPNNLAPISQKAPLAQKTGSKLFPSLFVMSSNQTQPITDGR
jgi:Helix-turn-helix domain